MTRTKEQCLVVQESRNWKGVTSMAVKQGYLPAVETLFLLMKMDGISLKSEIPAVRLCRSRNSWRGNASHPRL